MVVMMMIMIIIEFVIPEEDSGPERLNGTEVVHHRRVFLVAPTVMTQSTEGVELGL